MAKLELVLPENGIGLGWHNGGSADLTGEARRSC